MKKIFLTILISASSFVANSQFQNHVFNNDFDGDYKLSYSLDNNNNLLKLENIYGNISLYITSNYFCEEDPMVDLVFFCYDGNYKFNVQGYKSKDAKTIFLTFDLENSEFLKYFFNGTKVKIRVNDNICENQYFEFSLKNSTNAFKFIKQ